MNKTLRQLFEMGSFRTRQVLLSAAIQILVLVFFSITLYTEVSKRANAIVLANMQASAEQFVGSARFALISAIEADRIEFLDSAMTIPDVTGSILLSSDGEPILGAGDFEADILVFNRGPLRAGHGGVIDESGSWVILLPVYSSDQAQERTAANAEELLGYYGIRASKRLISELMTELWWVFAILFGGFTFLLLLFNLWLARLILRPVDTMIRDIGAIDSDRNIEPIEVRGPRELVEVAVAVNAILSELSKQRQHLESLVEEKTADLQDQREAAEESKRVAESLLSWRSALMALHTHEMLTPVRIIVNALEAGERDLSFSEDKVTAGTVTGRLRTILAQVKRIESIVDQLNASYQLEQGLIRTQLTEGTLGQIAIPLRASYSQEAKRNNNTLRVLAEEGESIVSDLPMIEKIAANLLSNACKFTKNGNIELSLVIRDGALFISCKDDGIGIASDKLDLIFEPLRQVDMSSRRIADGMGLGLFLVKGFAEKLGGTVGVTSELGKGAHFQVVIPIGRSGAETQADRERGALS